MNNCYSVDVKNVCNIKLPKIKGSSESQRNQLSQIKRHVQFKRNTKYIRWMQPIITMIKIVKFINYIIDLSMEGKTIRIAKHAGSWYKKQSIILFIKNNF